MTLYLGLFKVQCWSQLQLYVMATNSFLAAIKLTHETFTDYLKFAIDVYKNTYKTVQDNTDAVAN